MSAYLDDSWFDPNFPCVQVVKRVEVRLKTVEDVWALKLMNFMTGVNQLLFEGLTRELPL